MKCKSATWLDVFLATETATVKRRGRGRPAMQAGEENLFHFIRRAFLLDAYRAARERGDGHVKAKMWAADQYRKFAPNEPRGSSPREVDRALLLWPKKSRDEVFLFEVRGMSSAEMRAECMTKHGFDPANLPGSMFPWDEDAVWRSMSISVGVNPRFKFKARPRGRSLCFRSKKARSTE